MVRVPNVSTQQQTRMEMSRLGAHTRFIDKFRLLVTSTGTALAIGDPRLAGLDFDGNSLVHNEVEQQREKILLTPLVKRNLERVFTEELLVDGSGAADPNLPVLSRVSSSKQVIRLGSSYELVERLWNQFWLIANRVDKEVAWSRDEVLVSSGKYS